MALSFAQLTARESLRDIEINLRVQRQHFSHLGFRCKTISRNTLANANRVRPWEVFTMSKSSTSYIEVGAYYVMDKAYVDFARLHQLHIARAFFVTRAKSNMKFVVVQEFPVPINTGLVSDQHIQLTGYESHKRYPELIRQVTYIDPETGKTLEFLTNNMTLSALTICALYKQRWQVELFFKWIKQHLRIKAFFGTTENAVKTQIWTAIATYVLIAIVKKRLRLDHSLYEILRVLDLNMFETTPISALLGKLQDGPEIGQDPIQQTLFPTLGR